MLVVSDLKGRNVVKSNAMIEACYNCSLNEHRIILSAIAKIDKDDHVTDDIMYTISIKDIAAIGNIKSTTLYKELDIAAERLFKREIRFKSVDSRTGRTQYKLRRFVQAVDYVKLSGEINVRFSKDIIPFISNLHSEFTVCELDEIMNLNSTYAIRIYELLMQWKNVGYRKVGIDYLKELLTLESKYEKIKDFKRYVIDRAVKDINTNTKIDVKYTQHKTGRKITHLDFTFKTKTKGKSMDSIKPKAETKPSKNVVIKESFEVNNHPAYKAPIVLIDHLRIGDESTPKLRERLAKEGWTP